jgi:hypothetical protein
LQGFTQDIEASKPDMKLLTDHAAIYIAGISFEGAADTTRYTMQGFIKVRHGTLKGCHPAKDCSGYGDVS